MSAHSYITFCDKINAICYTAKCNNNSLSIVFKNILACTILYFLYKKGQDRPMLFLNIRDCILVTTRKKPIQP